MSTDIGTGPTPVVLAIQNDQTDPPLLVGQWLAESGISVQVIEACFGEQVPAAVPPGVHGVLALGGVMGAGDDGVAPWLVAERALLADATDRGIPVLGLCLGAQLLAFEFNEVYLHYSPCICASMSLSVSVSVLVLVLCVGVRI